MFNKIKNSSLVEYIIVAIMGFIIGSVVFFITEHFITF